MDTPVGGEEKREVEELAVREGVIEEWKRWWEKESKRQKLDLSGLKERCEAQRRAFRQREVFLMQSNEG